MRAITILALLFVVAAGAFAAAVGQDLVPQTENTLSKPKVDKNKTYTADKDVTYLAVGKGSCGWRYDDWSRVGCMNGKWLPENCGRWLGVTNSASGRTSWIQVIDSCPGAGEEGVFVTRAIFEELSGDADQIKANYLAGHIVLDKEKDEKITWVWGDKKKYTEPPLPKHPPQ